MKSKRHADDEPGRFAYDGIDRVMHEKARLSIMSSLVSRGGRVLVSDLKQLCALTDSAMARHLEVLREEGLVEIQRGVEGRRAPAVCDVTAEGRRRFQRYLEAMEEIVRASLPRTVVPAARPSPSWQPRPIPLVHRRRGSGLA